MKTAKRSNTFVVAALATTLGTGVLLAQDADVDTLYQGDLKPGVTVRVETTAQSDLGDAMRSGRAVVISGQPKSQSKTVVASTPRDVHVVKSGDTLWDICQTYYADPYVWPRVWSYNPNISNPHWIYPGDEVQLAPPGLGNLDAEMTPAGAEESPMVRQSAARSLAGGLLHRNRAYVDSAELEKSGVLSGSRLERMLLAQHDEAYVEFEKNRDIRAGDSFAVYKIVKKVKGASEEGDAFLVEIIGWVRVSRFDEETGVARVTIGESIGAIERGAIVGPVQRTFELVPVRANQQEMQARITAHLDPGIMFSKHQVVFIDKGHEDGVLEGNRFFATRKRDLHREMNRQKDAHESYPWEVIGEVRVIETRAHTSACIVTGAISEMEDGQRLEMVRGY